MEKHTLDKTVSKLKNDPAIQFLGQKFLLKKNVDIDEFDHESEYTIIEIRYTTMGYVGIFSEFSTTSKKDGWKLSNFENLAGNHPDEILQSPEQLPLITRSGFRMLPCPEKVRYNVFVIFSIRRDMEIAAVNFDPVLLNFPHKTITT